jgi:hypothetical protein
VTDACGRVSVARPPNGRDDYPPGVSPVPPRSAAVGTTDLQPAIDPPGRRARPISRDFFALLFVRSVGAGGFCFFICFLERQGGGGGRSQTTTCWCATRPSAIGSRGLDRLTGSQSHTYGPARKEGS